MRYFLLTILLNLGLSSCGKQNAYTLDIVYNGDSRYSYVFLRKNHKNIDSLRIKDYYGTSKIKKIEDSTWHVSHIDRSGTDISMKIQYIFKIKNGKIVNSLELPLSYEDIERKYSLYITSINKDSLYLIHFTFYNYIDGKNIINKKTKYTLSFDKEDKIYYNDSLLYRGVKYKVVSIDGAILPYVKNNWGNFKNDTIFMFNEY